jgi:hypothetical protein
MFDAGRGQHAFAVALAAVLTFAVGCRELESFSTHEGEIYKGSIVPADPIRNGVDVDGDTVDDILGPDTSMVMSLRVEEFQTSNVARVTTSDGLLVNAPLESVEEIWHDTLSGLTFPAGRLRSGMYFVRASPDAPGELANLEIPAVLSLMVDGSVELRLISGPDRLYALFRLRKAPSDPADAGPDVRDVAGDVADAGAE